MTKQQKYLLGFFGFISVALLFGGAALLDNGKISPNSYLWIQGAALFIGLFTLAGTIEKLFESSFSEFRVSALAWVGFLAITSYFARISALDDVNGVFHIDPSALPLTVIAASVMRFFLWMKWPFIGVFSLSVLLLITMYFGSYFHEKDSDADKIASVFLTISCGTCCGLAALFIANQLDDNGRAQKIYRTAQATDFVSKFNCSELIGKNVSVLFIGPEQRRVLVAPVLPAPALFAPRTSEFLQPLAVPSEFPVVDCTPSGNLQQWLKVGV